VTADAASWRESAPARRGADRDLLTCAANWRNFRLPNKVFLFRNAERYSHLPLLESPQAGLAGSHRIEVDD
jgi:hypothetical protein